MRYRSVLWRRFSKLLELQIENFQLPIFNFQFRLLYQTSTGPFGTGICSLRA
jgi:hypothetical protein